MNIILTVKTGKGEKSQEKEIDQTVDELMKVVGGLEKRGYKIKQEKCFCDGTQVVLER